jgi:hypothetical protein
MDPIRLRFGENLTAQEIARPRRSKAVQQSMKATRVGRADAAEFRYGALKWFIGGWNTKYHAP